jgi:hypothetical protein
LASLAKVLTVSVTSVLAGIAKNPPCGSTRSFTLFRFLVVCCFEIVFLKEIVKIRSVLSGKLGCLAHIAFGDFEEMDEVVPLIVVLGLLERFK